MTDSADATAEPKDIVLKEDGRFESESGYMRQHGLAAPALPATGQPFRN